MSNIIKKLFKRHSNPSTDNSTASATSVSITDTSAPATLAVIQTEQAEFLAGDLFRRRFNTAYFPEEPLHFVGFARNADGRFIRLGYIHYTLWGDSALAGGLVVDESARQTLNVATQQMLQQQYNSIGEFLSIASENLLPQDNVALWCYTGHPASRKISLRIGYEPLEHPYLMVKWKKTALSDTDKAERIAQAIALGPF